MFTSRVESSIFTFDSFPLPCLPPPSRPRFMSSPAALVVAHEFAKDQAVRAHKMDYDTVDEVDLEYCGDSLPFDRVSQQDQDQELKRYQGLPQIFSHCLRSQ